MHTSVLDEPPHVLIVDDHADRVDVTARLLEQFGALVATADNGRRAIELARASSPDLIMIDLVMPGMDGYSVAEALQSPPLPTHPMMVALSGPSQASDKLKSAQVGFDLHLVKPVNPAVLRR